MHRASVESGYELKRRRRNLFEMVQVSHVKESSWLRDQIPKTTTTKPPSFQFFMLLNKSIPLGPRQGFECVFV